MMKILPTLGSTPLDITMGLYDYVYGLQPLNKLKMPWIDLLKVPAVHLAQLPYHYRQSKNPCEKTQVIHSTFGGKESQQSPLQPIRLPQVAMGGPKGRQSITGRGVGPRVNGMTNHKFNEPTTSPRF
jgi:hypothetical protein